jgi:hypothetical protein
LCGPAQPAETWIKLFALIALPVVHDSVEAIAARVAVMGQDLSDAVDDRLIISTPFHMRELYFTTYSLPFLVRVCTRRGPARVGIRGFGSDCLSAGVRARVHAPYPLCVPPPVPRTVRLRVCVLAGVRAVCTSPPRPPPQGVPTRSLMERVSYIVGSAHPAVNVVAPEVAGRLPAPAPAPLPVRAGAPSGRAAGRGPPLPVVHVAVFSYQLMHSPTGHLLRCLMARLVAHDPAAAGSSPGRPGPSYGGGSGGAAPWYKVGFGGRNGVGKRGVAGGGCWLCGGRMWGRRGAAGV